MPVEEKSLATSIKWAYGGILNPKTQWFDMAPGAEKEQARFEAGLICYSVDWHTVAWDKEGFLWVALAQNKWVRTLHRKPEAGEACEVCGLKPLPKESKVMIEKK